MNKYQSISENSIISLNSKFKIQNGKMEKKNGKNGEIVNEKINKWEERKKLGRNMNRNPVKYKRTLVMTTGTAGV